MIERSTTYPRLRASETLLVKSVTSIIGYSSFSRYEPVEDLATAKRYPAVCLKEVSGIITTSVPGIR